jgi:hypothetical protein
MVLHDHITNNASNLQSRSILNKIEECVIAPHIAFAQIL